MGPYLCVRSSKNGSQVGVKGSSFTKLYQVDFRIYLVGNQEVTYLCSRSFKEGNAEKKAVRRVVIFTRISQEKRRKIWCEWCGLCIFAVRLKKSKAVLFTVGAAGKIKAVLLVKRVTIRKKDFAGSREALSFALPIEKRFTKTVLNDRK